MVISRPAFAEVAMPRSRPDPPAYSPHLIVGLVIAGIMLIAFCLAVATIAVLSFRGREQSTASTPTALPPTAQPSPPQSPGQSLVDGTGDDFPQVNGVKIVLSKVWTDKVAVRVLGGRVEESAQPAFQVLLGLINTSEAKLLDYQPWGIVNPLTDRKSAHLGDEHGNNYRLLHYGIGNRPMLQQAATLSLRPREPAGDLLVFARPVDAARQLILTLPATNLGGNGQIRLSIPRDFDRTKK